MYGSLDYLVIFNMKAIQSDICYSCATVSHNNRDFIARNVDGERVGDNIVYRREDFQEFYQRLFGKTLADYNAS